MHSICCTLCLYFCLIYVLCGTSMFLTTVYTDISCQGKFCTNLQSPPFFYPVTPSLVDECIIYNTHILQLNSSADRNRAFTFWVCVTGTCLITLSWHTCSCRVRAQLVGKPGQTLDIIFSPLRTSETFECGKTFCERQQ